LYSISKIYTVGRLEVHLGRDEYLIKVQKMSSPLPQEI
jgi:hypothetical protein